MPTEPITKQMIDDLAKTVTPHAVIRWRTTPDSKAVIVINALGQKFTIPLPAAQSPAQSPAKSPVVSGIVSGAVSGDPEATQICADDDTNLSHLQARPSDKTRTPPDTNPPVGAEQPHRSALKPPRRKDANKVPVPSRETPGR